MLITLLATVVVLGILILVHELGHFLTAKAADIEVPRFSIGLGPKAWGFWIGETEYVLSWVPLGGYVRMAGMEELEAVEGGAAARSVHELPAPADGEAAEGDPAQAPRGGRGFDAKPVWVRAVVIAAGVTMNMLFAFLVYAVMAGIWGVDPATEARIGGVIEETLPEGAEPIASAPRGIPIASVAGRSVSEWRDVQDALAIASAGPSTFVFSDGTEIALVVPAGDSARAALIFSLRPAVDPVIGSVLPGTPAAEAGMEPGDRVLRVDGEAIGVWDDLVAAVRERPGEPLRIAVLRGGREVDLTVTPASIEATDGSGRRFGQIGVNIPRERTGAVGAVVHGARETWRWTGFTLDVLGGLISGDVSARNVGGPILIGQLSGRVARAGIEPLLSFMALLSINLAIFNLLPIPILDGGQLVFLGVEAVRGRALTLEQRMRFSQVGLVILMALIVLVMANDILRLFGI